MRVLISLLGLSPGVVTGAYYALFHGWGIEEPIKVNKVVTLTTNWPGAGRLEEEIARELDRWRTEKRVEVQYDATCRERIEADDLNDEDSVTEFREKMIHLLREIYRDDEVYLVVAGGRKSMAALAAVAAQLYGHGVQGMYHLYVDKELEEDGSADRFWQLDRKRRQEVMRPPEGQCHLVDVAFFQIRPSENQGAQLVLRGRMQDYILQYLTDNPDLSALLEPNTWGNVLGYLFEVKVEDYLRKQGYTTERRYPTTKKIGDIDILAKRDNEILVCECEFRVNPEQSIADKKVDQAIKRLEYIRQQYPGCRVVAWVVSTAGVFRYDVNKWPKIKEYGEALQVWQAELTERVVRVSREQGKSIVALLNADWIRNLKPVKAPD